MDGQGAAAAATEGSTALVGADAAATAAASAGAGTGTGAGTGASAGACRSKAPLSPGNGQCSSVEAVKPGTAASAALASHPDNSRPASPAPTYNSGCQDLPQDEAERTPPDGGGLEQKSRKIKQIVEEAISAESRQAVLRILEEVNQLSMVEKLYLYLKLPTGKAAPMDPLRQPLNPLGSRFEIQQTITWIKTHLEEDPEVSLPKQDVYDEYLDYCSHNKMKPLSNADFGKVMKQVFPCVRPRRLGTRGNSRYCYSGMRKRMKLRSPLLPDLGEHKFSPSHSEDEIVTAASCLIREWAEKLLSVKFDSLRDLACHLVEKMCVDSRSVAAFTLLSVAGGKCNGKESTSPLGLNPAPPGGTNKHLETQMQLQRKLKEREMIREQKRKLQDQQQQTAALSKGPAFEKIKPTKRAKLGNLKDRRLSSALNPVHGSSSSSTNSINSLDISVACWESERPEDQSITKPGSLGRRGKSASVDSIASTDAVHLRQVMTASVPVLSSALAGEKRESIEDAFVPVQTPPKGGVSQPSLNCIPDKLPIPRIVNNNSKSSNCKGVLATSKADLIAVPNQKLSLVLRKKFYKPIQPKPENTGIKSKDSIEVPNIEPKELTDDMALNSEACITNTLNTLNINVVKLEGEMGQRGGDSNVKLENDPMSDYFHGGHNSQEQEEELIRYFQHQTSSSSNEELEDALMPRRSATADPTKSDELSQLRILLERNLSNATAPAGIHTQHSTLPCCPVSVPVGQSHLDDTTTNDDVFLSNSIMTIPPGASASASLSLLSQRSQQKKNQTQSQVSLPLQAGPQKSGLLPSLLTSNHNSSLSARRRVSFETSVTEHYQNDNGFQKTVPPSPNTRRKFFNFTPISAGPHSPLGQRPSAPSSKPSSANASPFVSPRDTPIPRNRHISSFPPVQLAGQIGGRTRMPPNKVVRSNSVSSGLSLNQFQPMRPRPLSTTAPLLQATYNDGATQSDITLQGINFSQNSLDSLGVLGSLHGEMQLSLSHSTASPLSLSAPQSPMISSHLISTSRSCMADETSEYVNSDFLLNDVINHSKIPQHCTNGVESGFFSEVGSNLQITQHQNQQQVPLPTPDPLAHEVSQFFPDDTAERTCSTIQQQQQQQQQQLQYRSQSVPLHRMVSTGDLMSPHYTMPQSVDTNFHFNNFSLSAASSVAPTPVPSECMDFTNITDSSTGGPAANLIIDGADPETELNSENLDRIFNILDDAQEQQKKEEQEKHQRQCEQQHQQEQHHHPHNIQQEISQQQELQQQEHPEHQDIQLSSHQPQNILQHQDIQLENPHNQDEEHNQLQRQHLQLQQHQELQQCQSNHHHNCQHQQSQQQLQEQQNEVGITLDLVAADSVSGDFVDLSGHTRLNVQSSRSYPNTPVPYKCTNTRDPLLTSFSASSDTLENSPSINGSRSLPPTPLLSILDDETTHFQSIVDRDPMLTLNALNSRLSDDTGGYVPRRNMNSLLEESLTLDTLDLPDCEGFSQLSEVESAVNDT